MTYDEKKTEELLRKIKLLKRKADDPGTTEAESLAFAAKVADMLAQHGLEEASLDLNAQEAEVGHEDYISNWNSSPARRRLAIAVCNLYFVKPIIRLGKKQPWSLVGRKHNILLVKEMATYLIKTTVRLSNQYGRENPLGNVIDFRRGCFARLSERITTMYYEQQRAKAEYTPQGNPMNLPALYRNEEDMMRRYIGKVWPRLGVIKQRPIKQGISAMAGRAAGDKISLNQQVSSAGGSSHLLTGPKK
jgi:Protein of unknown function (DUF2786)